MEDLVYLTCLWTLSACHQVTTADVDVIHQEFDRLLEISTFWHNIEQYLGKIGAVGNWMIEFVWWWVSLGITGFFVKRNSIDKAVIIEYKLNIAERPFWPNSCYDGCENVSYF